MRIEYDRAKFTLQETPRVIEKLVEASIRPNLLNSQRRSLRWVYEALIINKHDIRASEYESFMNTLSELRIDHPKLQFGKKMEWGSFYRLGNPKTEPVIFQQKLTKRNDKRDASWYAALQKFGVTDDHVGRELECDYSVMNQTHRVIESLSAKVIELEHLPNIVDELKNRILELENQLSSNNSKGDAPKLQVVK